MYMSCMYVVCTVVQYVHVMYVCRVYRSAVCTCHVCMSCVQECSMYVSVYSSMTEAPACHVYNIHSEPSHDPPAVRTQVMATLLQSTRT